MLRMGVTTAIGGNCGDNCCDPADYLDIVDQSGAAVNVGMLAGHTYFRRRAGVMDRYSPATAAQLELINTGIDRALMRGCLGVSYGMRYSPGTNREEIIAAARPCCGSGKMIAAHIRSDAQEVFAAGREILDVGVELGIPVQLSHIGSMAGFGQMESFLRMIDRYRMNGLDVSCDCYSYDAFSTSIGSATYDDGWMDRYGCSYDAVELCEGKYKGQRCTEAIFNEVRSAHPECLTVCYVMREDDVDRAFAHPNVMLASDGILSHGQGHPRAAGAFPRFLSQFARRGKLSLYDAISRMTAMPAARLGLTSKGCLRGRRRCRRGDIRPRQHHGLCGFSASRLCADRNRQGSYWRSYRCRKRPYRSKRSRQRYKKIKEEYFSCSTVSGQLFHPFSRLCWRW